MKQGTLFYDRESGRYNFHYTDEDGDRRDYGGIHCGEVFEFKLNDVWIPALLSLSLPHLQPVQRKPRQPHQIPLPVIPHLHAGGNPDIIQPNET